MGYYSDFSVETDGGQDVLDALAEKSGYSDVRDGYLHNAKWYEVEENLAAVSDAFPGAKITIWCEGEDGERWALYALGGKVKNCRAIVTYEPNDLW